MDKTEEFIRDRAALGWSRQMVYNALGISSQKFKPILEALPDVKWPGRNEGVGRKMYYESQRGFCSPARRAAITKAMKTIQATGKQYQIGSTCDIMSIQIQVWADLISVTRSQISRRLKLGMSIYDAFFMPEIPRFGRRIGWKDEKNRLDPSNHEKNRVDCESSRQTREFILKLRESGQSPDAVAPRSGLGDPAGEA